MRRFLFWIWFAYLVFVIYGSLVPLNFQPRPLDEAIRIFREIRYLELGIGNRADWVANLLLLIPLAFLSLAISVRDGGLARQCLASLLVWIFCISLSVAIEFVQIFFPPRTVSLNDILAEGIGASCGIVIWWLAGPRLVFWLEQWLVDDRKQGVWFRALQLYVGVLLLYNIMPLDLSLSPAVIYHKWKLGRVVLVPFGFTFASSVQMLYSRITDVIIWVPLAILLVINHRTRTVAWLQTVSLAAVIEFLQLFVYSRVTDVTQIILAAVGATIGVWSAARFHRNDTVALNALAPQSLAGARFRQAVSWALALVVWSAILAVVFWYPYDFNLHRDFVVERSKTFLAGVPFVAYYYGTEFRALTEVFHKTLFFAPCGVVIAMACSAFPVLSRRRLIGWASAIMSLAVVAAAIDVGRLLLPDKHPDIADWFLHMIGGMLGYWLTSKIVKSKNIGAEIG